MASTKVYIENHAKIVLLPTILCVKESRHSEKEMFQTKSAKPIVERVHPRDPKRILWCGVLLCCVLFLRFGVVYVVRYTVGFGNRFAKR